MSAGTGTGGLGRAFARGWVRSLGALRSLIPGGSRRRRYQVPAALRPWFRVVEIDDVERYAGPLFRRCFRADPPAMPRHYVALAEIAGRDETVGYVHHTPVDNVYLCGGMCVDERIVRRLPAVRRAALKDAGGIAEQMLRHTFAELAGAKAIFGYVGDKRALRVDLRAGFRHTGHRYLVVHWPRPLSDAEERSLVERVAKMGPF